MAAKNRHNLSIKQQAFCDLYRSSDDDELRGNAKQCYLAVYNCTEETAESSGPRLLKKNEYVAAYLDDKARHAECEADISEARILKEVARMAFLDPGEFYGDDGRLLSIKDMPEDARRCLSNYERAVVNDMPTFKLKFSDKRGPLELLMKYRKMLTDKVEHEVKGGGVLLVPAGQTVEEWKAEHYSNTKNP